MKSKKYLGWAVMGLVIYWMLTNPTGAADTVRQGFAMLGDAGQAATTFLSALT